MLYCHRVDGVLVSLKLLLTVLEVTKQVSGQWRIKPQEYQNYLEKKI